MDDENGAAADGTISSKISSPESKSHQECSTKSSEEVPLSIPVDEKHHTNTDGESEMLALDGKQDSTNDTIECAATVVPSATDNGMEDVEEKMDEKRRPCLADKCRVEVPHEDEEVVGMSKITIINGSSGDETDSGRCLPSDISVPTSSHAALHQPEQVERLQDMFENDEGAQPDAHEEEISKHGEQCLLEDSTPTATEQTTLRKSEDPCENIVGSNRHQQKETVHLTVCPENVVTMAVGAKDNENVSMSQSAAEVVKNIEQSSLEELTTRLDASTSVTPEHAMEEFLNDSQTEQIVCENSGEFAADMCSRESKNVTTTSDTIRVTKCPVNMPSECEANSDNVLGSVTEQSSLLKEAIQTNSVAHPTLSEYDGCHRNGGDTYETAALDDLLEGGKDGNSLPQAYNVETSILSALSPKRLSGYTFSDENGKRTESVDSGSKPADTAKRTFDTQVNGSESFTSPVKDSDEEQSNLADLAKQSSANVTSGTSIVGHSNSSSSSSDIFDTQAEVAVDSEEQMMPTGIYNEKWRKIVNDVRHSMARIPATVNPLKRRASDTPLEREHERRRRFSGDEHGPKLVKLIPRTMISQGFPGAGADVPNDDCEQNSEDPQQMDTYETLPNSEGTTSGRQYEQTTDAGQCETEEKIEEDLKKSSESPKAMFQTSGCDRISEETPGALLLKSRIADHASNEIRQESGRFEDNTNHIVEHGRTEKGGEEDDGNTSSSGSSSSSSDSSSSSSSSSSSESDSSDDEAEDSGPASQPLRQSLEQPLATQTPVEPAHHTLHSMPPSSTVESFSLQANSVEREQTATDVHNVVSEEDSRDSAAMEIDQSPAESDDEDEPDMPGKRTDEVKITRSEGLKLSISLKRSSAVATPTRREESPVTKPSAVAYPPQPHAPQPVDFSNLLNRGYLLNESQELKKIDYNHMPGFTGYTGRSLSSADALPKPSEVQDRVPQLQRNQTNLAPWNNDSGFPTGVSNIVNDFKSNHLVERLAQTPHEESSDTLDEDNRLVIAEKKQRRSRKKAQQNAPPSTLPMHPSHVPTRPDNNLLHPGVLALHHLLTHDLAQLLQQHPNGREGHFVGDNIQPPCFSNTPMLPISAAFSNTSAPQSALGGFNSMSSLPSKKGANAKPGKAIQRPTEKRKKAQAPLIAQGVVGDGTLNYSPLSNMHKPFDGVMNQPSEAALLPKGSGSVKRQINAKLPAMKLATSAPVEMAPPEAAIGEKKKDKKKVFLCSPCGTHYENWNLFLHMREVHRKHICLYCLGIFPSAERLVNHLGTKHGVQKKHHGSVKEYLQLHQQAGKNGTTLGKAGGGDNVPYSSTTGGTQHQQPLYLMCSRCEHMFESSIGANNQLEGEQQIVGHNCADFLEKCGNCGQIKLAKHRCSIVVTADGQDRPTPGGEGASKKKLPRKANAERLANDPSQEPKKISLEKKKHHQSPQPEGVSILQSELLRQNPTTTAAAAPLAISDQTSSEPEFPSNQLYHSIPQRQEKDEHHPSTVPSNQLIENHSSVANVEQHGEKALQVAPLAPAGAATDVNEPIPVIVPSGDVPPPSTTPLVPKLKVKIPIQYLTPMESEESSEESDEDDDDEEGEEEEDEEGDEVKDGDGDGDGNGDGEEENVDANAERIGQQQCDEADSETRIPPDAEQHTLSEFENEIGDSEKYADGPSLDRNPLGNVLEGKENDVASQPDSADPSNPILMEQPVEETAAEFTSQQEPIPMDIDETITTDRTRDGIGEVTPLTITAPETYVAPDLEQLSVANDREECLGTTGISDDARNDPTEPDAHDDSAEISDAPVEKRELLDQGVPRETECLMNRVEEDGSAKKDGEGSENITDSLAASTMAVNEMEVTEEVSGDNHDGLIIADSDAQLFQLSLDEPLDRIPVREFIRICLQMTIPFCLYCNHARRIAVCARQLVLHIIAKHRFQATVNSITGEELLPDTILQRLRCALDELDADAYLNVETYDSSWTLERRAAVPFVRQFECFQCRFVTLVHKELYLHNRKMHQKSVLICLMCRGNFFSYSELLCHLCPGLPNQMTILDYTFRCCVCNVDGIQSAFRLMVHLRKRHFACDVCLEECHDQGRLSNHVWKHKLHHLCYRCGIGYRNKADILKHLFWKHGTEGVLCKRCLQKKWPHVYHFCVPPAQFTCDVCQASFGRSVALKVHQRLHNGDSKYPCTEDGCEKRFISKKLLLKHVQRHTPEIDAKQDEQGEKIDNEEQEQEKAENKMVSPAIDPLSRPVLHGGELDVRPLEDGIETAPSSSANEHPPVDVVKAEKGNDSGCNENRPISAQAAEQMECLADADIKHENGSVATKADDDNGEPNGSNEACKINPLSNDNDRLVAAGEGNKDEAKVTATGEDIASSCSKRSKKKRKAKYEEKSMVDLMNLPALNLSESDSSDDSDNESSNASISSKRFPESANYGELLLSAGDRGDVVMTESMAKRMPTDGEEIEGEEDKPCAGMAMEEDPVAGGQPLSPKDPDHHNRRVVDAENEEDRDGVKVAVTAEENEVQVAPSLDPIANIWNNFKRYQAHNRTASRRQSADDEQRMEDELVEKMLKQTILHVSQSDHDYCMMYTPLLAEPDTVEEKRSSQQESLSMVGRHGERMQETQDGVGRGSAKKSQRASRSPRKHRLDHSSDSDSSDTDSSCECGSNCSCSSSSSNSSSSSSDDSDSSDEEAKGRSKKQTGEERKSKTKTASQCSPSRGHDEGDVNAEPAAVPMEEVAGDEMLLAPEPQEPIDPDTVIVDSDLYTDESETDEEFYDEHPQKRANQMLAEKRKELLEQTCAVTARGGSPAMMSYGIVENSRPSTPSLPPEEQQLGKKKPKVKKRKRERKSSKRMFSPTQTANVIVTGEMPVVVPMELPGVGAMPAFGAAALAAVSQPWVDYQGVETVASPLLVRHPSEVIPFVSSQQPSVVVSSPAAAIVPLHATVTMGPAGEAGKISTPRLSTGNSSESDAPLKRSQRCRKPNKFYGYTSDDESAAASLPLPAGIPLSVNPEKSILSLMKPTPPPNLVWSKEDLPSPPAKSGSGGGGSKAASLSTHRRSTDHLTPVSSRRNSGIGTTPLDEVVGGGGPLGGGGYVPQASLLVSQMQPMLSNVAAPIQLQRPPLPKLKLSLGKATSRVSKERAKRATGPTNRRRKATTRAPKTPKSAPPLATQQQPTTSTLMMPGSAPLSAPIVQAQVAVPALASASASIYHPPIIDNRPKIPPIGSFPSVQTDLFRPSQIRRPAGWRAPREGESVYCYCRAPYDEVSEMIACDGENCRIEWFHFECVSIIMPPKGKWFCPDCKLNQPPVVDDDPAQLHQQHQQQHQQQHHGGGIMLQHPPSAPNGLGVVSQSSTSTGVWGQPQQPQQPQQPLL